MTKFETSAMIPPLRRTYWVLEGQFLAGAYAGQPEPHAHAERLTGLFNAGVRTVVNLMEEDERNFQGELFSRYDEVLQSLAKDAGQQVACLRFPIVDGSITSIEQMQSILNVIDQSLAKQRPVYVHCYGGIGRTGTVVCCWLLRHGYATKATVFDTLRQLRQADRERASRPAPENETQREFVRAWPEPLALA